MAINSEGGVSSVGFTKRATEKGIMVAINQRQKIINPYWQKKQQEGNSAVRYSDWSIEGEE